MGRVGRGILPIEYRAIGFDERSRRVKMDILPQLWLPVLVSAVVVFILSFLDWMVLPHHKADVKVLPDEKVLTDHLRQLNLAPGMYMWPNCSGAERKSAEFKARYDAGPWGSMTVLDRKPNFALNLFLVFVFYVLVSVFVGYLTANARAAGAAFAPVFQVAGATAVLGYCAGAIPGALFFGKPGRFMLTDFIDSLVYGLATGLIFAWLWPAAAAATTG